MIGKGIVGQVLSALRTFRDRGTLARVSSFEIRCDKDAHGRWHVGVVEQFDKLLWLTPECDKLGCNVRSQFLIQNLADGVVHWRKDPEDEAVTLVGTLLLTKEFGGGVTDVQQNPTLLAQARRKLVARCHDNPTRLLRNENTVFLSVAG